MIAQALPDYDDLDPWDPDEAPVLIAAAPDDASGSNQLLPFRTARELVAELPESVPWTWWGYVAEGAVTELVGAAKRAGKSTMTTFLIRAILDGLLFLGRATTASPVVLLTEQPGSSLRELLVRAGLQDRDDLVILAWHDSRAASWPTIVAAAEAECARIGARVLVVDTLGQFAGIRGDSENDAGAAAEAMAPLQAAAGDGLAVVVLRHERKSGGDVGTSGRGSSAFTGAVDIVLRLARQENPVRPTVRVLTALSRFDATPDEVVIELTDTGYIALGDTGAVAFAEARRGVLDVLPDDGGLTLSEIIERTQGRRTTTQAALASLVDAGDVVKGGTGRRNDPIRYRRTAPAFLSAGRPTTWDRPGDRPAEEENAGRGQATDVRDDDEDDGGDRHRHRHAGSPGSTHESGRRAVLVADAPTVQGHDPDLYRAHALAIRLVDGKAVCDTCATRPWT